MELNWYVLEYSYLLGIEYNPVVATLDLRIDARMSIDHPKVKDVEKFEDHFEDITLTFVDVRHIELIKNQGNVVLPEGDLGNIDRVEFVETTDTSRSNLVIFGEIADSFVDGDDQEVASALHIPMYCKFVSEHFAFRVGFERIRIST